MKKKLFLIMSMCLILMFGLSACEKTDPTEVDYNGFTYEQLQSSEQNTITTLLNLSEEDKANYLASGQELTVNLINRWDEACEDAGQYVDMGEFTITKSGKTLTTDQEIQFAERPVIVSFVYNYNTMELEDVNINAVQSLGEKMSSAVMNTIMGIGTVFVILIMICLIIYAFRLIPYFMERKQKKAEQAGATTATDSPVVEQIAAREAITDDTELIAVIAAAIAAATGTSTDDFVVRSIKRR